MVSTASNKFSPPTAQKQGVRYNAIAVSDVDFTAAGYSAHISTLWCPTRESRRTASELLLVVRDY